jgi:hypothetical protein
VTKFFDVGCQLGKYALILGALQVLVYIGIRLGTKFPLI